MVPALCKELNVCHKNAFPLFEEWKNCCVALPPILGLSLIFKKHIVDFIYFVMRNFITVIDSQKHHTIQSELS